MISTSLGAQKQVFNLLLKARGGVMCVCQVYEYNALLGSQKTIRSIYFPGELQGLMAISKRKFL